MMIILLNYFSMIYQRASDLSERRSVIAVPKDTISTEWA